MVEAGRPVYTIGTAAELLGVHPRTLRLYEEGGLLRPARKNNRRYYSENDIVWIGCVRYLLHEKGLNQEGLRRILALIPCDSLRGCANNGDCKAPSDRCLPCWELARRAKDSTKKCHACDVYVSARSYLMEESELAQAQAFLAD